MFYAGRMTEQFLQDNSNPTPFLPTVMIVENDTLVALDLAQMIDDLGANVQGPYRTNSQALATLGTCLPDLALVDLELDDGNSLPLIKALTGANVPVTVLTGHRRHSLTDLAVNIRAKPYSRNDIREEIAAIFVSKR